MEIGTSKGTWTVPASRHKSWSCLVLWLLKPVHAPTKDWVLLLGSSLWASNSQNIVIQRTIHRHGGRSRGKESSFLCYEQFLGVSADMVAASTVPALTTWTTTSYQVSLSIAMVFTDRSENEMSCDRDPGVQLSKWIRYEKLRWCGGLNASQNLCRIVDEMKLVLYIMLSWTRNIYINH